MDVQQAVLLLLLLMMGRNGLCEPEEVCLKSGIESCSDCIRSGPHCAWCQQLSFSKRGEQEAVRCDTRAQLRQRGCEEEEILYPENTLKITMKKPLSTSFTQQDPVQISPQKVHLNLRPGLPTTFTVSFKRAEGYPVDLYYLMDLSYSMKDDLEKVKNLGTDLFKALEKITAYAQIGFGAFVDKTVLPYTNTNKDKLQKPCDEGEQFCQAAFGYRHVLSMTSDREEFREIVGKQYISGNLDSPEGSLDAMMQAAICGMEVGWRNNSTRLLVLATDAGFHMAGDGKLAGILEPNDEQCHMKNNLYIKSSDMDYPSVGQLAIQLEKNNIQPIFAVTQNVQTVYKELSKMIPKSEVGVLSEDSRNVVQLIENAYNRLSSKVTVTHDNLPEDVRVEYTPLCKNGEPPSTSRGVCNEVLVGEKISFNITVTASSCVGDEAFTIKLPGIRDTLAVSLSTDCECHCKQYPENPHPHCQHKGAITCGTCSCLEGHKGQHCNCSVGERDEQALRESCQRQNGTDCEGRGDCECGRCQCHTSESGQSYYGTFCECDDEHCEKFQNKQCAGNGKCKCGNCECDPGFEGSACHCKTSVLECVTPNNTVCFNRGRCLCGQCRCNGTYQPPHCEKCLGCPDPCLTKMSCIECLGFESGPFRKNCSEACRESIEHTMVSTLSLPVKECRQKDSEGCWVSFRLEQGFGMDYYRAEILEKRECPEPPNVTAIIAGSVAAVVLIGLLLLMLFKLYLYLKYLKEWKRFENEKKKSKWSDGANPLFKEATTTTANPIFTGE